MDVNVQVPQLPETQLISSALSNSSENATKELRAFLEQSQATIAGYKTQQKTFELQLSGLQENIQGMLNKPALNEIQVNELIAAQTARFKEQLEQGIVSILQHTDSIKTVFSAQLSQLNDLTTKTIKESVKIAILQQAAQEIDNRALQSKDLGNAVTNRLTPLSEDLILLNEAVTKLENWTKTQLNQHNQIHSNQLRTLKWITRGALSVSFFSLLMTCYLWLKMHKA